VVIQRVTRAAVTWESGRREIGLGLAILVGVGPSDDEAVAERLAEKVAQLRIFQDPDGKTNRSLTDVAGAALVVSQFTLYADVSRGRRPGFTGAAAPEQADRLYRHFAAALEAFGIAVQTGSFGAEMDLELVNHGPFTVVIDTDNLSRWCVLEAGPDQRA
jgi:D-tyrosyl-tRNA(Tyr) deacylase